MTDACRLQNREIRFEVTNKCNASCIMCPREKMTRPQGIMDLGLYKRVLDEAISLGATVVSLENYGETFIDPHFFERARYAKEKNLEVYTITNGSLFTPELAHEALRWLDKIRFSIYGTTKEVYEKIHRGLRYETVIANVEYLIKKKKETGGRIPRIEVYLLLMEENKHQAEDFKKRWLGVADDISIWRPHNWSDGRGYRPFQKGQKKVSCGRPQRGPIQIQWDGLVVPCCFDYNSSIILGDVKTQSLFDALTSREYDALRRAHESGDFGTYPFCDGCDQLRKREDVLVFTTIKKARVGNVNTTYDSVI